MNKSFKYILLILMISFIIAILCRRDHLSEQYSPYPFKEVDKNRLTAEQLQDAIFKYNVVIQGGEIDKAGGINYHNGYQKDKKITYTQLPRSPDPKHMEYESILDKFPKERIEPQVKTKQITIELEADIVNKVGEGGIDVILEKDIRGDPYFEPNACKGGWSDWNKSNCGEEKNRCGIQFKKYEIIEIEKNDKNGPGKPCDYKDGEIKYRYCVGSGNDTYESNKERCGTSKNSCVCKLNQDSVVVLDGENVYDLEDEDCQYQREVDCVCPPGFSILHKSDICKLTPGTDCSVKEPGCIYTSPSSTGGGESCKIPEFINEETKNNFYKKYSSFDGKCKERTCTCENGEPVIGSKCISDGLEICDIKKPCKEGYYYEGNPPICKKQTAKNECSCLYGKTKIEETNERCKVSALEIAGDRIMQLCDPSKCPPGYRYTSEVNDCNEYYPENDGDGPLYNNIQCCVPNYDRCLLLEDELTKKFITRKESSSELMDYYQLSIGELFTEYGVKSGIETGGIEGNKELLDIIKKPDPKDFLIQELMKLSDSDDKHCMGRIELTKCANSFRCKPGYSFLPDTNYETENELRMVSCEGRGEYVDICEPTNNCERGGTGDCQFPSNSDGDKKCAGPNLEHSPPSCEDGNCNYKIVETHYPIWNGTCVPVTCPVSDEVKEIYNITYENCSSNNPNCGLSNVTCKKEEYDVSSTNKMIYCRSPLKVSSDYLTTDYELVHTGCSKTPPPPTEAQQAREAREAERSAMVGEGDADLASARVREAGITAENIEEEASFTGTTSEEQFAFETGGVELRRQHEIDLAAREENQESAAAAAAAAEETSSEDTEAVRGGIR